MTITKEQIKEAFVSKVDDISDEAYNQPRLVSARCTEDQIHFGNY